MEAINNFQDEHLLVLTKSWSVQQDHIFNLRFLTDNFIYHFLENFLNLSLYVSDHSYFQINQDGNSKKFSSIHLLRFFSNEFLLNYH